MKPARTVSRKVERNILKKEYKKFCKYWREQTKKDVAGRYVQDGNYVVCPTFSQWVSWAKNEMKRHQEKLSKEAEAILKSNLEEFKDETSLEWE